MHRTSWVLAIAAGGLTSAMSGCSCSSDGGDDMTVDTPQVNAATTGGDFSRPLDSVPDTAAGKIYFTASNDDGAGVFSVPLAGGDATAIYAGEPYVAPFGIDLSSDGTTLYVADSGAGNDEESSHVYGTIFTQSASGGAPATLAGSEGKGVRGLFVGREGDADVLYFTAQGAVFKIDPAGGAATEVASGEPLTDPSGITATAAGTVYVLDTVSSESGRADLLRIEGGSASVFLPDIAVGYPAGLAMTRDESGLVVSALSAETGNDQVFVVDLATQEITALDSPLITQNVESAGLHRAKDRNTFSWADSTAGGKGTVYRVDLPE